MPRMTPADQEDMLALACELATDAGKIILDHWGDTTSRRKPDRSPVTQADLKAEEHITTSLAKRFCDHDILAEESAADGKLGGGRFCWVVDPLDGTRNFTRGFPCVATSIALVEDGTPVVGVIREHIAGHTYWATASQGAYADGTPVHVAKRSLNRDFFVGVPSVKHDESPRTIEGFLEKVNVRNVGSTAVHLALVACGAIDAAYAMRCYSWDIAAGYLLIAEAGGVCTTNTGGPCLPLPPTGNPTRPTPMLASGPHAHAALLDVIRRSDQAVPE